MAIGLGVIITAGVLAVVLFFLNVQQDFAKESYKVEVSPLVFNPVLNEPKVLLAKLPSNEVIASLDELKEFQADIKIVTGPIEPAEPEVLLSVPFTAQAPFGQWSDPRQDYGCEEASLLMAWKYINNQPLSKSEAKKQIIAMSDWEDRVYGEFRDTSAFDTMERFKQFFSYDKVRLQYDIGIEDIKAELALGNPVIVPVNGRVLDNPYYTPPGPPQHMLVVVGFDDKTQEFITNDPGTRRGEQLRYSYNNFNNSLRDYVTGHSEPVLRQRTAMIVIDPLP